MTLVDFARQWHAAGATPIPVKPDGTKAPAVSSWRQWQHQQPDWATLERAFAVDHDGIGVLTGACSGGLEMLELEGRAVAEGLLVELNEHLINHGLDELWRRVCAGYLEFTPSGGLHVLYRVTGASVGGSTRLASRPATEEERLAEPKVTRKVLIETRGQGGFVVVAPSAGRTHRSGAAWTMATGGLHTIVNITADERDALVAIAQLCDKMPIVDVQPPTPTSSTTVRGEGGRPGDDFNEAADWADILVPAGWQCVGRGAGGPTSRRWVRPGKKPIDGISATTGVHGTGLVDRLFVFSTSTEFPTDGPISKFAALAILNHGGNYVECAKAIARGDHGQQYRREYEPPRILYLDAGPDHDEDAAPSTPVPVPASPPAIAAASPTSADNVENPVLGRLEHDALALRLVSRFGDRLRYCPQRRMWLVWDGARWRWDEGREHREVIRELARQIPEDSKITVAFRRGVLTANGVGSVADLASSDRRVSTHIDSLDAHPWQLNTPRGAVDLRTGELTPARPELLHTRTTTVAPDPHAPSPLWHAFLDATFAGDLETIGYVQRLLGACLVGRVLEQVLPFWYGSGANGKSTLIEVVMAILGKGRDGYAIAVPAEMLMMRRNPEHPTELAQLAGVRLAVASELEDGAKFAESRVKQLTGGDSINARFMRADPFTFTPTASIILIGNHKPSATVGGPAFWRRLQQLDFPHVVAEADRDTHLQSKLEAEHGAILAWLTAGAAAYAEHGLQPPATVRASTRAYEAAEDTVGRFVADLCTIVSSPGAAAQVQTRVTQVRSAYEKFCFEAGDTPVSARRFTQELRDRFGVDSEKGTKGSRFYRGLSVLSQDGEEES